MGNVQRSLWVPGGALGGVATVLVVVAALLLPATPALADTFSSQTVPGNSSLTTMACPSTTTCVALGSDSSGQGVVVTIDIGASGAADTFSTQVFPALRLNPEYSGIACASSTSCVASGMTNDSNAYAEVVPITIGSTVTVGTPQVVPAIFAITGVACASPTSCVAVGPTQFSGSQGVVVPITIGTTDTVGATQVPSGLGGPIGVTCPSATTCEVFSYGTFSSDVTPITIGTTDTVGAIQSVPGRTQISGMACASPTSCEAVGPEGAIAVSIGTPNTFGTVQAVSGVPYLTGVACPSTTSCEALGQAGTASVVVPIVDGIPGVPEVAASFFELNAVVCLSANSCVAVGINSSGSGDSGVLSISVSALTATISGQITYAGTTNPVVGSPVQACNTDGVFCTAPLYSTDSSGDYSLPVPPGSNYVVTAFSPAGQALNQGSSSPVTVPLAGQGGVDISLAPGPGLISGMTITGAGGQVFTHVSPRPVVNWGSPFQVHLPAAMFPSGETTTVETLVVTGVDETTGRADSLTVYAGGETTIASGPDAGQSAAIGLVVGPSGIDLTVPPLAPIHGAVSFSLTSFSVPNPPTGVALAGANPVLFTNGSADESATIVATDFGVAHTIGAPTISGPDASMFSVATSCQPSASIFQNASGTPGTGASCAIGVDWSPPATPGAALYQATMNVPVTDSAGRSAVLPVPLLACDTRLVSAATCGGSGSGSASSGGGTPGYSGPNIPIGGVYVDPSGIVQATTSNGSVVPLSGASVTLLLQDPTTSLYSAVPQGSDIMSPGNQINPQTTVADGSFGWDTLAGTYQITAQMSGCTSPVTSPAETVPPPATGLVLTLNCPGLTQASTTTSLVANPSPITSGQAVTFTATVGGASPSGTVSLTEGGTLLSDVPLDASNGVASFTTAALAPGNHAIVATYSGDAANAPSSAPTTIDVVVPAVIQATQTTAFTSNAPSPATVGGTYTPNATGGGSGSPVTFSLDGTSTGCTLNGSGVVSFTTVGICVIDANQAGTASYMPAAQVQQTITVIVASVTTPPATTPVPTTPTTTPVPTTTVVPIKSTTPAAKPRITINSGSLVLSAKTLFAPVKMTCSTATCSGSVQLTETITTKVTERFKVKGKFVTKVVTKTTTVVLASTSYKLAKGMSGTFNLVAKKKGPSELIKASRKSPLHEKITVAVKGGVSTSKMITVT